MPYAPVQAKAARGEDGVTISFVRRGRIEADAWEPVEIPLGEDIESYEVRIAHPSGERILRSNEPSVLYTAADLAADFATPPPTLDLTVRQVSAAVGPGFPLSTTIPIL